MSTALLQIIANDKLTGDNYTKWKHNINAILVTKDLKFVLTEECPVALTAHVAQRVREAYEKWVLSNEKAGTYLLASMTDVLVTKHEAMTSAFEIMESLQAMFGQPFKQKRHEAVRFAMLARMKEGTSVREHVLNMMSYFNTVEINGGAIDEPSQLLNELTTFESLTKDSKGKTGEANVAEPSSSNNKKRKRSAGKAKGKPKPKKARSKKKDASINKSKGKCFHCDKVEHWKRNCPQYLEEVAKKKKTKDVYGPMNVKANGGYEYVTFIDDYSRYGYVYLMQQKSETFEKFKEFRAEVENQLGKTIKTLRSDCGGEYLDQEFEDFMVEYGIVSQLTAPVPSKSVPKTPLELWNGRKVSLRHFYIWGCPEHVLKNKIGKLDPKSVVGLFVGYSKETRDGYFYSHEDNKVFVSTNATFLEDNYISNHKPRSKIVLNELEPGETSTQSIRVVDPLTFESQMIPSQDTLPPKRSERVVRQPECYLGVSKGQDVVSANSVDDPLTFKNAMEDPDKEEWLKAMNLEMESMYSNSVWELVDLPDGVKPIGCKWIYKRKRRVDGKVETFKARLVVKGYT
ncbi:hypothetical protein LWI29_006753 [Acer saccharum]|uniref:Integrase catalytic domain-containing protein n=1 Tax=Acer saccharum TaxID=4024 RepID=A0AA39VF32_ACESA|nr:hypothetical protein LWI29_006753 [Acer saccharum]